MNFQNQCLPPEATAPLPPGFGARPPCPLANATPPFPPRRTATRPATCGSLWPCMCCSAFLVRQPDTLIELQNFTSPRGSRRRACAAAPSPPVAAVPDVVLQAVPGNPAMVIQSGWQPPFSLWQACAGEPAVAIRAGRAKPSPCGSRLRKNGLGLRFGMG